VGPTIMSSSRQKV